MKLPKLESSCHYSEKSKKSQQYGYFLKLVPRAKSALGTRLLLSMVPSVSLLTGFDFNRHIHIYTIHIAYLIAAWPWGLTLDWSKSILASGH